VTGRDRKALAVAFLIAALAFAWQTYRFNWVIDDAFISYRYAKHLAQGAGLRFNVGEDPPVEGYSNLLWVLLLAPFERIGWPVTVVSRVLSVACGVVLLWRVIRFLQWSLSPSPLQLILSALFFATLPPVAMWATSGLATMPCALLIFLTFEFVLAGPRSPRPVAGAVASALLVLVRVDGMIWVGGVIVLAVLVALVRRDKTAVKPIAVCAAVAAITLLGLTCFRLAYHGWLLPNTVYAKTGLCAASLQRGGRHILSFLAIFPHLATILAAAAVVLLRDRRAWTVGHHAGAMAVGAFAYAVVVGGDWMPMGRFLVPAMPFLAVLFALLIRRMVRRTAVVSACALTAVVLSLLPAYNWHVVPHDWRRALRLRGKPGLVASEYDKWVKQRRFTEDFTALGRALSRHTKLGESLIAGSIGAVGYYTELFIYDTFGLANVEVAHREIPPGSVGAIIHDKSVPRSYFLKYRPTYYSARILELRSDSRVRAGPDGRVRLGKRFEGLRSPEARALYEAVGYLLPAGEKGGGRKVLLLHVRRDLL